MPSKDRLEFQQNKITRDYHIYNEKEEYLGSIEYMRVGRFMHWCFVPIAGIFFTNGCLKEIVEFITKLYGDKKNV